MVTEISLPEEGKIKKFIKRKIAHAKQIRAQKRHIAKEAESEYFRAKEEEAKRLARYRAEQERRRAEERFRYRPTPPRPRPPPPPSGFGFGTSGGGLTPPPPNFGIFGGVQKPAVRIQPIKKRHRKRRKKR